MKTKKRKRDADGVRCGTCRYLHDPKHCTLYDYRYICCGDTACRLYQPKQQ